MTAASIISRWRISNHRGEAGFGCKLSVDTGAARKLAHAAAFLHERHVERQQAARLYRRAEFGIVDRHEVNKLAASCQPKRMDGKHTCRLRQRFDDQNAGHDRAPREMPVEETFVDRYRLDGADRLIEDDFLDPVDQQHRVTVRQCRHHRPDIKWTDGGRRDRGFIRRHAVSARLAWLLTQAQA